MTSPGGGRSLADVFVAMHVDASKVPQEVRSKTERQMGDAGEQAGSHFGRRMAAAIGAAALAGTVLVGAKLIQGLKGAVDSASNLNETMSKSDVIFGKNSDAVKKWAANMAADFGQSQKTALDAAATFAIYGKAAKITGSDLVNFSTDLTGLASDMASFSNTSPEEAIQAIGAAMRGESDPIEKYGVLLNESVIKNRALKEGIISSTKDALTPQQRVLAVNAELFAQLGNKGSKTLGDFERTSAGLANQQRIAAAQTENLKAKIGTALLPVMTTWYKQVNTKIIPALNELWTKHGPAITAWLQEAAVKFGTFADKIGSYDWNALIGDLGAKFASLKREAGPALDQIKDSVGPMAQSIKTDLVPALKDLKEQGGTGLSDTIKVTGTVMKFAADNVDILAKALPYLAVGYGVVKVAQLAAHVAMAASPFIRLAEVAATKAQTSAMREQTAALIANKGATAAGTVATGAATGAESVSTLTKIRNAAATVATTIASKAARAAALAWTGVQWALNAAMLANPIGLIVLAIIALIAIVVLAYQKNETFRKIVQAVWAGIKTAIKAVGDWFVNTLWPSLKKAYEQLQGAIHVAGQIIGAVWKGIWTVISTYYGFMWNKVFLPLKNVVTKTIPDAFRAGTAAVGKVWAGLQELAAKPVRFVIDTVINKGIIGTFNKVSGFFGGPKVPTVGGIPSGGGSSGGDKISGNIKNDGYGIGDGPGIGDGLGGMLGFLKGPAKWMADRAGIGAIAKRFGNNPLARTLAGMGTKVLGSAIARAKALIDGGDGGSVGEGGLRSGILGVMAALRSTFGSVPIISGLRPGATTLTGNRSYHAAGRAVDLRPFLPWAKYLNAVYGGQLRELITPWQELNILNGRPHTYRGAVWNQHNFPGGNAHIHAAMDDGGRRFLMPGLNVIPNGTGKKEPIYGPAEIGDLVELLEELIAVARTIGSDVGKEINGVGATLRRKARTA